MGTPARGGLPASPWAICLDCDRRCGKSLSAGWRRVLTCVLTPTLAVLVLLYRVVGEAARR